MIDVVTLEGAKLSKKKGGGLDQPTYPNRPTTPSGICTSPRFVAGIQISRASSMNWNRVSARVLEKEKRCEKKEDCGGKDKDANRSNS
jgi:hypothetical protein